MTQIQNHWLEVIGHKKIDKAADLFKFDLDQEIEDNYTGELTQDILDEIVEWAICYGKRVKIRKDIKEWKLWHSTLTGRIWHFGLLITTHDDVGGLRIFHCKDNLLINKFIRT